MSDSDLLTEYVRQRSDAAFSVIVARYIDFVYSAALRQTGDVHLAEDVTQAVFIVLFQKASDLPPGTLLPAWLFNATRLAAIDAHRKAARRQHHERKASSMATTETAGADASWIAIAPLLDEALSALNEKERSAILLRFFENKTVRELGGVLGMSEDAAEKRVSRALDKLRGFFGRRGMAVSGAALMVLLGTNAVQAAPAEMISAVPAAVAAAKGGLTITPSLTLAQGVTQVMAKTQMVKSVAAAAACVLFGGVSALTIEHGFFSEPLRPPETVQVQYEEPPIKVIPLHRDEPQSENPASSPNTNRVVAQARPTPPLPAPPMQFAEQPVQTPAQVDVFQNFAPLIQQLDIAQFEQQLEAGVALIGEVPVEFNLAQPQGINGAEFPVQILQTAPGQNDIFVIHGDGPAQGVLFTVPIDAALPPAVPPPPGAGGGGNPAGVGAPGALPPAAAPQAHPKPAQLHGYQPNTGAVIYQYFTQPKPAPATPVAPPPAPAPAADPKSAPKSKSKPVAPAEEF